MVWKPSIYDLKHNVPFRVFLAETLGMTVYSFIGIASTAQVLIGHHLYPVKDWPWQFGDMTASALGNGLGLALAFAVCARVCGYHLNPAATLALAAFGKSPWRLVPVYLGAQVVGACVAATVAFSVHVHNVAAVDKEEPYVTDAAFASYPVGGNSSTLLLVWDQTWAASLYALFLFGLTDVRGRLAGSSSVPFLLGAALTMVMLAHGINAGTVVNPARDLCSRLFTFLAQYGTGVWTKGASFFWIPLVLPFPGALLGALIYHVAVAAFWPPLTPEGPSEQEVALRKAVIDVRDMKDYLVSKREEQRAEEEYREQQKYVQAVNVDVDEPRASPRTSRERGGPGGGGGGELRGIEIDTTSQQ